ncbi:unnamed protein product [Amoebophrya sp. A25]|nr:unnamed protein product [Amoebophrya sp. A25]|eukprot:GSA25T00024668001.1
MSHVCSRSFSTVSEPAHHRIVLLGRMLRFKDGVVCCTTSKLGDTWSARHSAIIQLIIVIATKDHTKFWM